MIFERIFSSIGNGFRYVPSASHLNVPPEKKVNGQFRKVWNECKFHGLFVAYIINTEVYFSTSQRWRIQRNKGLSSLKVSDFSRWVGA